jgi:uncharacterized protein (DUF302 family)
LSETFSASRLRREAVLSDLYCWRLLCSAFCYYFPNANKCDDREETMKPEGLITVDSTLDAAATLEWIEAVLGAKGATIYARIDHAAGASAAGMTLPPTTVLIFGNPVTGTPLMQKDQRLGLDLPLRILVWTDEAGKTHMTYNDPFWFAGRYGIFAPQLGAMRGMLDALADGPPHSA